MPERTVNGFPMHFLDEGKGEVILLLHGLGGNCHEWDGQIGTFSKGHRVIAPDLRGHGLSEAPSTPRYTPYDHARDVVALLDSLGIEKAWSVGLSAGGFVTLVLAVEHPDRLHGIVLAATAPFLDLDTRMMGQRWMDIYQKEGVDAYLSRVVKDIFTLDYFLAHEKEVDEFLLSQKHRSLAGIAPSALGNIGFDVRGELPKIYLPTLVIHGLSDRVIDPAYARRIRQSVVGAEVKLLDSGHIVNIEAKEEFNQIVLEFVTKGGKSGT